MQLFALDFDQTIIHLNSDIVIRDKLEILPPELEEIHKESGWTGYMQRVFDLLHDEGVTLEDISSTIKSLEAVPGMLDLVKHISEQGNEIIVISDANSYFIETWLKHQGLYDKVSKIFTNPAKIVDGKLTIEPYHIQSQCKLSSRNLCKGQVLEEYIRSQKSNGVVYDRVIYVGDGANDVCPILRLSDKDLAFVRENYRCQLLIKSNNTIRAKVVIWSSGDDILKNLQ